MAKIVEMTKKGCINNYATMVLKTQLKKTSVRHIGQTVYINDNAKCFYTLYTHENKKLPILAAIISNFKHREG
ncbi:hypothetical protein CLV51_11245 [Chitinophaga niastensis]|uniref:Uncharacterized protein n=1 Tax=Chitinophaga niastensis TaxID=536980 RepID=A0A2P8H8G1_CHINA|nr:hypothetical protein [Chitinophaga niastensis]PSL42517.1 hypothetical protein CLV51_11245 [Chitinophaga niastensis]